MTSRSMSKLLAAGAMSLALTAGSAHAAVYDLQFTGTDVSGDVFAQTTGNNVTAIWGSVTDSEVGAGTFAVTGLNSYAASDNTLTAGSPYVTLGGLSFSTAGGGNYNLSNLGGYDGLNGFYFLSSVLNPGGGVSDVGMTSISMEVTAVPEPSNLALIVAGMLGLFGVTRRRSAN